MTGSDGWEGILQPGETILWQGQPDATPRLERKDLPKSVFGLLFAGFALFWILSALQAGGAIWMFGLIHLGVGLWLATWPFLGKSFVSRRTWYTLTDRRAIIASDLPWRRRALDSYPITADTPFEFQDTEPGTIWFGERYPAAIRARRKGRTRAGFERIGDARGVYRQMLDIQRAQRG